MTPSDEMTKPVPAPPLVAELPDSRITAPPVWIATTARLDLREDRPGRPSALPITDVLRAGFAGAPRARSTVRVVVLSSFVAR